MNLEKSNEIGRIGIAKGCFDIPAEFEEWDSEIEEMFSCLADSAEVSDLKSHKYAEKVKNRLT